MHYPPAQCISLLLNSSSSTLMFFELLYIYPFCGHIYCFFFHSSFALHLLLPTFTPSPLHSASSGSKRSSMLNRPHHKPLNVQGHTLRRSIEAYQFRSSSFLRPLFLFSHLSLPTVSSLSSYCQFMYSVDVAETSRSQLLRTCYVLTYVYGQNLFASYQQRTYIAMSLYDIQQSTMLNRLHHPQLATYTLGTYVGQEK